VGLLEREQQMGVLAGLLERTRAGGGSVVAIEGQAGIGKTALLSWLHEHATSEGARVLSARGATIERESSLGVCRQLFERLVVEATPEDRVGLLDGPAALAGHLLGVGEPPAPSSDPGFATVHGLYWLCSNLADSTTVVLAVDDAHHADATSWRFLSYLAPRLEGLRVLVAVAVRPAEVGEPAAELLAAPTTVVVAPGELSEEAVAVLVRERLPDAVDDRFCHACHAATGGNPFLLRSLLHAVETEPSGARGAPAEAVLSLGRAAVGRTVMARIAKLPEQCRQLAQAVAVLGSGCELRHAAGLAALDRAAAAAALDELAAHEILRPDLPVRFVHPLIESALLESLAPAARAQAHAQAARLLASGGTGPARVAAHLLAAYPDDDPWVVRTLQAAAGQAMSSGGADIATRYLKRALAEPAAEATAAVLEELAAASLSFTADASESIELLEHALALTSDNEARARLTSKLAGMLSGVVGTPMRAIELVRGELELLADIDRESQLRLRAELILAAQAAGLHPRVWEKWADGLSDLPGDTPAERYALATISSAIPDVAATAADIASRALGDGLLLRDEGPECQVYRPVVLVMACADRFDLADQLIADGLREARRRGSRMGSVSAMTVRAQVAMFRGDLLDAEADAAAILELSRDSPGSDTALAFGAGFLAQALAARGAIAAAAAALARYDLHAGAPNPGFMAYMTGRASVLAAQGRHAQAVKQLMQLVMLGRSRPFIMAWASAGSMAAELTLALGHRAEAEQFAQEELRTARVWGAARPMGIALRSLGLTSQGEERVELLREAVLTLASSPARLEHARALVYLGRVLRQTGDRPAARDHLRQAMDLAERCGARPLAEQARQELVIAGARPRRQRISGAEALTASERRVATMAADGMTNREIAQALFITTKTVAHHLTHIYQKLNIDGREGLAGALRAG
jgi:ATP/maltotriose-dependent transcriptional regulator MalT